MTTWWGSDDSYEQRSAAAWSFLEDGNFYTPIGGTSCNDSFKCATGYSCVNGKCVSNTYLNSNNGSCDSNNPDSPGKQSCYNQQPSSGCDAGTCGSYYEADCCGERCCRFDNSGTIRCFCGPCPESKGERCGPEYGIVNGEEVVVREYGACDYGLACVCELGTFQVEGEEPRGPCSCQEVKPCVDYCDEQFKTNGTYAGGCYARSVCDECSECTGEGNNIYGEFKFCQSYKSGDAPPCWCPAVKPEEGSCTPYCNDDGTFSDYYPPDCAFCCRYGDVCPDKNGVKGRFLEHTHCSTGYNPGGAEGNTQFTNQLCATAKELWAARCAKDPGEPGPPDPGLCYNVCDSGTVDAAGPCGVVPDGPPGTTRTQTGCMEKPGGGVTYFYTECYKAGDCTPGSSGGCTSDSSCGDSAYLCSGGQCTDDVPPPPPPPWQQYPFFRFCGSATYHQFWGGPDITLGTIGCGTSQWYSTSNYYGAITTPGGTIDPWGSSLEVQVGDFVTLPGCASSQVPSPSIVVKGTDTIVATYPSGTGTNCCGNDYYGPNCFMKVLFGAWQYSEDGINPV